MLEDDDVVICIFIVNEVSGFKLLYTVFIVLFFGVVVFIGKFIVESRLVVISFISAPSKRM